MQKVDSNHHILGSKPSSFTSSLILQYWHRLNDLNVHLAVLETAVLPFKLNPHGAGELKERNKVQPPDNENIRYKLSEYRPSCATYMRYSYKPSEEHFTIFTFGWECPTRTGNLVRPRHGFYHLN